MHSSKPLDELVKFLIEKKDRTIVDAKAFIKKKAG